MNDKRRAMIAGYPASAFDLHTYEGRIALGRFGRECPLVAAIINTLTPAMRDMAMRHGVFIAEGGILAKQLRFTNADHIEDAAHEAELAFSGLDRHQTQHALIAAIQKNLDHLHRLREHVFGADRP